jgi:hypothetical protein
MTIDPLDLELLVDRNEIAHLLGVGPTAVSNYVARTSDKHPPFPEAVITRSLGRFRLWDLDDVEQWHTKAFPGTKPSPTCVTTERARRDA